MRLDLSFTTNMEFFNFSISTYLQDIFKLQGKKSDDNMKQLFVYARMFDQLGMEAYSMSAPSLMEKTEAWLNNPKSTPIINKYPALKTVNEKGWENFLFMPQIANHIRPIHNKRMAIFRSDIEGKLSQSANLTNDDIKRWSAILKQLVSLEHHQDTQFITADTVPAQHYYPCINRQCDNTILTYIPQPVICVVCGTPLTQMVPQRKK